MSFLRFLLFLSASLLVLLLIRLYALPSQNPATEHIEIAQDIWEMAHPGEYALYHQSIRTPSGKAVPEYPPNYQINALLKAQNVSSTASLGKRAAADSLPWIEQGPFNVTGRARVVLPDPSDPTLDTWYIGTASGGVWKTENRGNSWTNLTRTLTNLATTTLAIPRSNPDVIYAGTGEGFGRTLVYGQGLWKSEDRGLSWIQLPSTADDVRFTNVMRVIVHPDNPDLVVVASAEGIRNANLTESSYLFQSSDGGATWTQTYTSEGVLTGGRVEQVIASPHSFDIQYASVSGRSILKSTDAGRTWTEVFSAPSGTWRMELAISPTNPSRIYIAAQTVPAGARLYVSSNSGEDWTLTEAANGNNINWLGQQGWYGNTIAVHPYDEFVVYTGGIDLMRITLQPDLRTVISPVTDAYNQYPGVNAKGVHVDHHGITLVPVDSSTNSFLFLNANDGGFAYSLDAGATFTQTGESFSQAPGGRGTTNTPLIGLNTTQFYGVDKMNGSPRYVGGTQDNGSWMSPNVSSSPDAISDWRRTTGGDGFEMAWHYTDPTKMLSTIQFNVFLKSTNTGISWRTLSVPGAGGPFITRLAKSNQDPDLVLGVDSIGVLISEDFGSRWELLKPEGWAQKTTRRNGIVRVSQASPDVIWAGSHLIGDSTLYVSTNGATSFSSTQPYDLASMGPLTGLDTHPTDPNTAYATFSYANKPKILRTTDLGQTWTDLTGFGSSTSSSNGFPDVATYCVLAMPFDENTLWAGTEIGLFESLDGGQSWQLAPNGLPSVSIWQMRIVNDEVVLATHGRGIWSVSLPELQGYEPPPTLLRPIISNEHVSTSNIASFQVQLRQPSDSTVIEIDGVPLLTLESNTTSIFQQVSIPLSVNETRTLSLTAVSYVGGVASSSRSRSLQVLRRFEPQLSFSTDFSTNQDAFDLDGFSLDTPEGFFDTALHSAHPYGDDLQHIARLLVPIIVSDEDPIIRYDDIALIETGTTNSQFGDANFFDYVVLEGTNDGIFWTSLADGYDARFNPAWEQALSQNATGTPALFTSHEVNLLDTFAAGEEIQLRFRLFADQNVNGWGWAIDNLSIQESVSTSTAQQDRPVDAFSLDQNYPNPFQGQTTIRYSLATPGAVSLTLYDMLGRRVETLASIPFASTGSYELSWDGQNLANGTYHLVLETEEGVRSRRMVKID